MSPEQAGSGEAVGPWTDVWAFGLIVFFLLTGRMYWLASRGEGTPLAAVREICFDPFAPARARARELDFEGELPEAFDAWFARTVARETAARFASCGEATIELARVFGLPESDRVPSFESLRHSSRPTKRTFPPPKDSSPIEATQLADHVSVAHAKTELDLARPTLEPPPRVRPRHPKGPRPARHAIRLRRAVRRQRSFRRPSLLPGKRLARLGRVD